MSGGTAALKAKSMETILPKKTKHIGQELQLLICTLGIYLCYLRYGLLQERIYSTSYGAEAERFTYSSFLVAVQTATNAAVALLVLALGIVTGGSKKDVKKSDDKLAECETNEKQKFGVICGIPIAEYAVVSLSYLSAMLFSFTALNHMSYPMQALGKSCKMIPVMLMGIVIRKRRYSAREFVCVFLITVGVAMFSWKSKKSAVPTSPLGFALLFASLFMDGVTGPLQERLVARHKPSTHELMFWQNICSVAWLSVGLFVSGEGMRAISFVMRHPMVMTDVMLFSLVSAIGQNFIFYTVRNFNALIVTTITTTRKMFTVLLSIFVFNHAMVPRQWIGLILVFAAIAWEAVAKQQARKVAAEKAGGESAKKTQ